MMRYVESVWLLFFLLGLLVLGTLGTWDETAPFWYGAAPVAVAGAGALLSRHRQPERPAGRVCLGAMLLFYAYLVWRVLTSDVRWLARQELVFATTAVIAYLLIAVRFTGPRQRGAVLTVFALLILANVITGLHQFFQDPDYMVFQDLGFGRVAEKSASGFYSNSNHMAGFLILSSFPLLGVAVLGQGISPFLRALGAVMFAVAGLGVGFSTSRGGAVAFFSALALFICLALVVLRASGGKRKSSPRAMGWWLAALTAGFVLLLAASVITMRKFYGNMDVLSNLSGRGVLWDAALEQWQSSPLFGTGARSYEYMERAFRTLDTHWFYAGDMDAIYAHNDVLQCLGDYGLAGLLLILTAVAVHFFHALLRVVRMRQRSSADPGWGTARGLAVGGVCSLAGIAVHSMADFNLHIGTNVVMAGILMGFVAAPGFLRSPNAPVPDKSSVPPFSPAVLCLSAIAASLSIPLLNKARILAPADYYWAQGFRELKTAESVPEWLQASGYLQKAVSLDPENANAWRYLGVLNTHLAKEMPHQFADTFDRKALDQLMRSLELYPQNPYASSLAGSLADYLGEKEQAEALFSSALRWGLNIQTVNHQYGDHLAMFKKDYRKAIGFYIIARNITLDQSVRANIQRKIDRCVAKLDEKGEAAPPETFLKPGDFPPPADKR